ncbi:MAG: exopolyphosphatase [Chitinophagales bacterium]
MKLGAIDIGSNAIRLLLMNVYETPEGPVFVKDTIYRLPLRLGEEAFLNGKFSTAKVNALIKALKAFKNIIDVHGTEVYMACATSAMREASNSKKVIEKIKTKTGIDINVISGSEEADIIFSNQLGEGPFSENTNYLYIDVGGGSTELVLISDGKLVDKWSFNIGTLRLKHNMVSNEVWREMRVWLYKFRKDYSGIKGIGSGGNINHILKNHSKNKNNILSLEVIEVCYSMLKVIPDIDKQINFRMRPDRADVIVPALEIFKKIMNWLDIDEIYVPKLGLPDGIIKKLYEENKDNKSKKSK